MPTDALEKRVVQLTLVTCQTAVFMMTEVLADRQIAHPDVFPNLIDDEFGRLRHHLGEAERVARRICKTEGYDK